MPVNGILNVNKPAGISSFGAVARARRVCGERRAGHGGTLDLEASGVLPVFLGKATRAVDYLLEHRKTYHAVVRLGIATDTYDAAGKVTATADASSITIQNVRAALPSFCGEITQMPPVFSALKHNGKPLYRLARAGAMPVPESRRVRIYSIDLLGFDLPLVEIEVECARGTYIRSIANDLGKMLGCGAHLESLIRTKYGPFELPDALKLDNLEASFHENAWQDFLKPIDFTLRHLPMTTLSAEQERVIRCGGSLPAGDLPVPSGEELRLRAYTGGGEFLGVVRIDPETGLAKAEKVFI